MISLMVHCVLSKNQHESSGRANLAWHSRLVYWAGHRHFDCCIGTFVSRAIKA